MVDLSIKARFEWLPLTMYAIFRNKRRSFAMMSGIILATTILSGIFLYSAVLEKQNFDTIVNNAPFEIGFDLTQNETQETMQDFEEIIGDRYTRILDSSILAQEGDDFFSDVSIDKTGLGVVELETGDTELRFDETTAETVFVNNDFFSSKVGQSLIETNFEGDAFQLDSGNTTVIPRGIASKFQLRVGDTIKELNITFAEFPFDLGTRAQLRFEGTLQNVEVTGIYEIETGEAGLFSQFLEPKQMFLSNDLLDTYLPELKQGIVDYQGYTLAIKINEDEFDLSDPDVLNTQINRLITEIVKDMRSFTSLKYPNGFKVSGYNLVEDLLLPFAIFNFFITIFDVLLVAPAVILSLYLLIYGIEMALEERRREIAIKKVQGANSRQIFNELRNEALILFLIGSVIGNFGGMLGAWLISSAAGFLKFQISSFSDFQDFITFDRSTIGWTTAIVGLILIIQIYKKGRAFIDQEVSEAVQRYEKAKVGFLRKNKLDIIFFLIGATGVVIAILDQQFGVTFNLSLLARIVINGLGPFFFWIGGALIGARIAKQVPLKLEGILLSLAFFKDIKSIIRSGLRRRGETDRLAIIIVLTLSIATLAAAQGITDEQHSIRTLEWEVGSDFQVNYAIPGDYADQITNLEINSAKPVESVLPLGIGPSVTILDEPFNIFGLDSNAEYNRIQDGKSTGIWHDDAFNSLTPSEALKLLNDNPMGIFVSGSALGDIVSEVDEEIDLTVVVSTSTSPILPTNDLRITILGTVDHIPGGLGGNTIITSSLVINRLAALASNNPETFFDDRPMNASKYLVKMAEGSSMSTSDINLIKEVFRQDPIFTSDRSLKIEVDNFQSGGSSFGIPGLLSLNFIVSVSAALISTFAFTAILMERRKGEFAVLRAIGAKKGQIYKIAIGENVLLVSTSVIWGIIIGSGIIYLFNLLFVIFSFVLGGGPLTRQIIFPWLNIILIGIATTMGMLAATLLSVRGAAKQDLSVATRVV